MEVDGRTKGERRAVTRRAHRPLLDSSHWTSPLIPVGLLTEIPISLWPSRTSQQREVIRKWNPGKLHREDRIRGKGGPRPSARLAGITK